MWWNAVQYSIFVMFMSIDKTRKAKDHKKHKSSTQKKLIANRKKLCNFENYANLEYAKKKLKWEKAASKYKSMDVVKKEDLL